MKPIEITADVLWQSEGDFAANAYSRAHLWRFDGGIEVPASASPHVVPLPHSVAEAVDPEEAYLAALSSCHMLWFLDFARREGWQVAQYLDRARAEMTHEGGKEMAGKEGGGNDQPQFCFTGTELSHPVGEVDAARVQEKTGRQKADGKRIADQNVAVKRAMLGEFSDRSAHPHRNGMPDQARPAQDGPGRRSDRDPEHS